MLCEVVAPHESFLTLGAFEALVSYKKKKKTEKNKKRNLMIKAGWIKEE